MPEPTDNHWQWLSRHLRSVFRKESQRKVGVEIERIGLWPDGSALRYHKSISRENKILPGASELMSGLSESFHWNLVRDDEGNPTGLTGDFGKVTLEPGCQVELSSQTASSIYELFEILTRFEKKVNQFSEKWGLKWLCVGVDPIHTVEETDLIPSPRYQIMTDHFNRLGMLGTSMMRLTSSIQINLDYTSEEEAIEMLRAALVAAPVAYALFSNSPIFRSRNTGFQSYRQEIWRQTDPDRTGMLPEAFASDFNFDSYAKLAWERPLMYAQTQDGSYLDAQGMSLEDISQGKLPKVEINQDNLINSIQQLFFEARLKPGFVEVRSIDGRCPRERLPATAFWVGLLYGSEARKIALERLGHLSAEKKDRLLYEASKKGLEATVDGISLKSVTGELLQAAYKTLEQRGFKEEHLLAPAFDTLNFSLNPAQRKLIKYFRLQEKNPGEVVSLSGRG